MPRVPIPNQPVFTFNYNLITINMRGSVVNKKNKVATLYAHGNVIRGTQTITGIPVVWTGFTHRGRIFIHGYFLTPFTPFASTRFRIPFIVYIWKVYTGYCNVIATMTETVQDTFTTASVETDLDMLKPTWVQLDSGIESDDYMTGHFDVNTLERTQHTMSTAIRPIVKTPKLRVAIVYMWREILRKLRVHPLPVLQEKELVTKVSPLPVEQDKKAVTKVSLLPVMQEKKAYFIVHLGNQVIQGTFKLSVNLVTSLITKTSKLSVKLVNPIIHRVYKLSSKLVNPCIERIGKLSAVLVDSNLSKPIKVLVHLTDPYLQALHRLKVHVLPVYIEGIFGRIQWLIHGHKITQYGDTTFTANKMSQSAAVRAEGRAYSNGKFKIGMKILAEKVMHLLHIRGREGLNDKSILHVHGSQIEGTVTSYIHTVAESLYQDARLLLNYTTREEPVEVNIDVIPGLAHRQLEVKPVDAPQVKWLNILVTVLHTETLTFIKFAIDEMAQDTTVRISMFEHEIISLLQWYIHGGVVSNEGYGNEVIFDLGEPDDGSGESGGTIPPIPSRQWSGGYVEDPFKGVGYEPTSTSTGYVSPRVTDWLSGSKMYWGQATKPFQEA